MVGLYTALALTFAALVPAPEIDVPIVDTAGVLSAEEREAIAKSLVDYREQTGIQMAALLVQTTGGEPIEDFAQRVFDRWGGGSAERNDGVLFVLAIRDRRSRLHLGYGIEPLISDALARSILDDLKPKLRATDYAGATQQAVAAVRYHTRHIRPGAAIPNPVGRHLGLCMLVLFLLGVPIGVLLKLPESKFSADDPRLTKRMAAGGPRLLVPWSLLLIGFVAVPIVFRQGPGFWWAYLLMWSVAIVAGVVAQAAWRSGKTFSVSWTALSAILLSRVPAGQVSSGDEVFDAVVLSIGLLGCAVVPALMLVGMLEGGGSGSGSSSSYSSTSSYSSSSYSSSSSSSYSSSSWSGGGGSSGGGGASSGW